MYRTIELNIILRNKKSITADFMLKVNVKDILDKLQGLAPWILTGYSGKLKKVYRFDFDSLVKKVDNTKMQVELNLNKHDQKV